MTASADVRLVARDYLIYAALASVIGVFAFAYDGIYVGATWTRDMRNLMIVSLAIYLAAWWLLRPYGNAGLWIAILIYFGARGALQAMPDIRRWRVRRSTRPRLRGNRRGIAPDRIGKRSSRPMRRKSSRSFLIAPTRPTPRKTAPSRAGSGWRRP